MADGTDRHPGVQNLLRWLKPNPRLPEIQYDIVVKVDVLAQQMLDAIIIDGPELIEALRKLLEAKDAFVRASFGPQR